MTQSELLTGLVADALTPSVRRALHPETTYADSGKDIVASHFLPTSRYKHQAKKPLAPRDRLSTNLALLQALTECKKQIALGIMRDTEAIEDAKAHNSVVGL